jgi:hypothetical protein
MYLFVYLIYPSIYLSIYLSFCVHAYFFPFAIGQFAINFSECTCRPSHSVASLRLPRRKARSFEPLLDDALRSDMAEAYVAMRPWDEVVVMVHASYKLV